MLISSCWTSFRLLPEFTPKSQDGDYMKCHVRHFNETLHLPLCDGETEKVYELSIRQVLVASAGSKLIGEWSLPARTSFLCHGDIQGKTHLRQPLLLVLDKSYH